MNTKTFKRLITSIEIILVGAIFLLFLGTCLNIEPIKGLNLTSYKYNGYKAFFGFGSEFGTSVGSIIVLILLALIVVLGITSMIFPKISIVFNLVIALLAMFSAIFIFLGTTTFMVNRYSQSVNYFEYYCSVNLGYGAILAGICALLIFIGAIAQEVYSFKKR